MIFTAWGRDGQAHTLIEGLGPPRFADGTLMPDCPERIWTLFAASWDHALEDYHQLQGWKKPGSPRR